MDAMNYVVDGNNVLFAARDVLRGPPIGRHQLCRILGDWATRTKSSVTIVFDGPPPRPAVVEQMRQTGVDTVFAGRCSADDVIQDMIDAAASPANVCIVSSDRAIESAARHRACARLSSKDFLERVVPEGSERPSRPQPPLEKPDESSPAETEEWLHRFGFGLPDEGGESSGRSA